MSKNNQNQRPSDREKQLHALLKKTHLRIHFIGIGGVSMYGLACLAKSMGADVSGSDISSVDRIRELSMHGIPVFRDHRSENIGEAELVVYSHAISEDNPELGFARESGILTVSRAEYLGAIMLLYKTKIGVSGTHGKSTTTAMLGHIFEFAWAAPTVLSGSDLPSGEPMKIGGKDNLIYEACEYKNSFLSFSPSVAIALNLEFDHPDYFADLAELKTSFVKALARATKFALISDDDENLKSITAQIKKKTKVVTFGTKPSADYSYFINSFTDTGYDFTVTHLGKKHKFSLNILGTHNVTNAVAAIAAALELGFDADIIARAVESFSGIPRRLELVGNRHGRAIYYDYAHHPTEISASISTLKLALGDTLTVVFKPHTYTRTASLWEDFCSALSLADKVIITDIYPAREQPIDGVNSRRLAEDIGDIAEYASDTEVIDIIDAQHTRGAIVLMGAGELENVKYDVLNR